MAYEYKLEPGETLVTVHPGEILEEDFIKPFGLTHYRVAKQTGMQQRRLDEICSGARGITMDSAIRLGRYFKTTPQFWVTLQSDYELRTELNKHSAEYESIQPIELAA